MRSFIAFILFTVVTATALAHLSPPIQVPARNPEMACSLTGLEILGQTKRDLEKKPFSDEPDDLHACLMEVCPKNPMEFDRKAPAEEADRTTIEQLVARDFESTRKMIETTDRDWLSAVRPMAGNYQPKGAAAVSAHLALFSNFSSWFADTIPDMPKEQLSGARAMYIETRFPTLSKQEAAKLGQKYEFYEALSASVSQSKEALAIHNNTVLALKQRDTLKWIDKLKAEIEDIRKRNPELHQYLFTDLELASWSEREARSGTTLSAQAYERLLAVAHDLALRVELSSHSVAVRVLSDIPPLSAFVPADKQGSSVTTIVTPQFLQNERSRCETKILAIYDDLRSKPEMARVRRLINTEAKGIVENGILKAFSTKSARTMRTRLRDAQVSLPASREDFLESLKGMVNASEKENEYERQRSAQIYSAKNRAVILPFAYSPNWYSETQVMNDFNICGQNRAQIQNIGAIIGFAHHGQNEVGAFGQASSPVLATSVGTHEFTHLVDPESLKTFGFEVSEHSGQIRRTIKACLAQQHGLKDTAKLIRYQGGEDFADLLGWKSPIPGGAKASFCTFTERDAGNRITVSRQEYPVHSPYHFRILHEAFLRDGKLSPSCQKYVSKHTTWNFKDCLSEAITENKKPKTP